MRLSTILFVTMIALGAIALARGARGETLWQLKECRGTGEGACADRGAPGPQPACHIDAASLTFVVPTGTRIRCDRVTERKEVR